MKPNLLEDALQLAADGWRIFPCDPETKRPLTGNGFKDATDDTLQIRRWWARKPQAMIGAALATVVIDIDPQHGATPTALTIEERYGDDCWGRTLAAATPNGGVHYHYQPDPRVPQGTHTLGKGIDTRTPGRGYVILPPSRTADGRTYQWWNPTIPPAPLPAWILEVVE